MGRAPCCAKVGLHKGPWTTKEDALLTKYVQAHGEGQWKSLPKKAGLLRCGKSCRLRWMNYLRPDIKRGNITPEEDDLIIRLHSLLGNRWSLIAGRLPGRTDNEIKNYWNTHLLKKMQRNQQTCDATTDHDEQEQPKKKNNNKKKKRTNKEKKSDKKKGTNNDDHKEEEKIQVYLPKAIRIKALNLPRTDSGSFTYESNSSNGSQQKEGTQNVTNNNNNNNVVCEVGEMGENDGFGHDYDLVNVERLEMECESYFDTCGDHGTLDRLYDEYLQLLNMDVCNYQFDSSFVESFFDSNNN